MKTTIIALALVLSGAGPTSAASPHAKHVRDGRPPPQFTYAPQSDHYGDRRHEPRRLGAVIPGTAAPRDVSPFHRGPWPIYNGFDQQPTEYGLRALHHQDVTPDEAREIDRLYRQLLPGSDCPSGLRATMAC
jgi:hypothetical protein